MIHAYALSNLVDVQRDRGDFGGALDHYQRSLEQKAELGSEFALAHTWNSMAALWRQQGDLARAREFNERALALRQDSADPIECLLYRLERGHIALAAGQSEAAQFELREDLLRWGVRHEALRAAWLAASARWQSDAVVDFELRDLLETHAAADRLPMLTELVAESLSFAIAVWASGCREGGASPRAQGHARGREDSPCRELRQTRQRV